MKRETYARAAGFGALLFASRTAAGHDDTEPALNLMETAIAASKFTTLVAALDAADLDGTLESDGPFTVFAPTDAAFDGLPSGTVEALLRDPAALADILLYHVIPGEVSASEVGTLTNATTLLGEAVRISTGRGVQVNDANVTQTDIRASNGIIHVIDQVLIPLAKQRRFYGSS